jgi:hypothetical protein
MTRNCPNNPDHLYEKIAITETSKKPVWQMDILGGKLFFYTLVIFTNIKYS